MFKLFVPVMLLSALVMFSSFAFAQSSQDNHVVQVQTWKLKDTPMGNDATAFNEMLARQWQVMKNDSRVLNTYALRHYWGADSRDMIMIAEFKNKEDLFAFNDDFNSMMEKAYSKEQLDKDDALWAKYIGHHADEIYQASPGTSK